MANFNTHIVVGAVASGALATAFLGAQIVKPQDVLILSTVGAIGGMLPDIDSDNSTPVKLMFLVLSIIFAFMVMFARAEYLSIIEMWIVWGFCYALVRYVVSELFKKSTVHRGIFHSIVAGLFFWFLTTVFFHYFFNSSNFLAWMTGFFMFFGFIIHLSLDEIYSVDLLNKRIKSSSGTALKIYDYDNYWTSGYMFALVIVFYLLSPSSKEFLDVIFNLNTYIGIFNNLLIKT